MLALFALLISIKCIAQDMQKYLSETQEMVTQKKYQEANERYAWFQNHALEYDQAMIGVRLSFALSYWKSLADIYPPAMTAMKEMRDKKTTQLLDSNGSINLFADIAALNRTFNEENKTIENFEKIEKLDYDKAKTCWYYTKDALFKAKRYDIIRNYVGNPMNEFQAIKDQRNMLSKPIKGMKKEIENSHKNYIDNNFVEKTLELINFSVAVDDIESAEKIRNKAMKIVKDNRLRDIKITNKKA